ncbi:MAG: undecaprenyl-diphosphatase [Gammaproteobacteria bacterium]
MELAHLIILGIIQGLTEFLPISSSAHLILLPALMGWNDQGIVYDVAVHAGSLGAVLLYFRKDLQSMTSGWIASFDPANQKKDYLLWYLMVATIPVGLSGLFLHDFVATTLRDPQVIASASIGFGLMLWWADKFGAQTRERDQLGWRDALLIGVAQAIAIIPGTSRSGITITAGLMLGMNRQAASRFSFLLAVPVIILATAYETFKLSSQQLNIDWISVLAVSAVAFVTAWLSIHYFLRLLDRTGMLPYVIYRVVLGLAIFAIY